MHPSIPTDGSPSKIRRMVPKLPPTNAPSAPNDGSAASAPQIPQLPPSDAPSIPAGDMTGRSSGVPKIPDSGGKTPMASSVAGATPTASPVGGSSKRFAKPKLSAAQGFFTKEDEEDIIIAETDIYLNHLQDPEVFLGELFMLQYPHRPVYRPTGDQGRLRHVDYDKKLKSIRMRYKLDNQATHYNRQAKFLAKEHVIRGNPTMNNDVTYCVATMHDGNLILAPLQGFLQCRAEMDPDDASDDEDEAGVLEEKEVKVTTQRKRERENKFQDLLKVQKPDWEELVYFDIESQETKDCYKQFVEFKKDHVEFLKDESGITFIQNLCGAADAENPTDGAASMDGQFLTASVLSRMTLEEQIEALLWESPKGMSYQEIRTRLSSQMKKTMAPHTLMESLQKCCLLVQDVWLLKNEILGFDDWLGKVREAVMLVLQKTGTMKLKKINDLFGKILPPPLLLEIAKSLGEVAKDTDMEDKVTLHVPEDKVKDSFPSIKDKYTAYWDMRQKDTVRQSLEQVKSTTPLPPQKIRQLQEARLRLKLQYEVRVLLCQSARTVLDLQKRTQQRHANNNISESLMSSVLQKASLKASVIRNVWFLQSIEGWMDPYRKIIIELFKDDASITMPDVSEMIRSKAMEELSDLRLRQLVSEFATLKEGRWVFREA